MALIAFEFYMSPDINSNPVIGHFYTENFLLVFNYHICPLTAV